MNEINTTVKAPWISSYGDVPAHLEYSNLSMYGEFEKTAGIFPDYTAYIFMGRKTSYREALAEIKKCAASLKALGINENDKVTICLPNCPQAVLFLYAVNMIGAVATFIHPLSSQNEIAFYLKDSRSTAAITLDQFYGKFEAVQNDVHLSHLIVTSIKDALSPFMKLGYSLTEGRKIAKVKENDYVILWKNFLASGKSFRGSYRIDRKPEEAAVMLYSGGTTGISKGVLLSNLNFNALGAQIAAMSNCFEPGNVMLAVMPVFHGFGLGVSIHSILINGACSILVPRFTPKTYAEQIIRHKPNYIAGVPSLFEALLRNNYLKDADLSFLLGIFSGGDSLSVDLKKRFDDFLTEHKCKVKIREGYGTTESVTASCLTPYNKSKEGSIGIPLPDTYYKIIKPDTEEEVPYGEEGEICMAGPTVMMRYENHPEETARTLRKHKDGLTWVHTGDLGCMDEEGFIYFKQRIKRIIVTNGYNVFPSQIEKILDKHDKVFMSCVIGVKDAIKIQKVKAFVRLKDGIEKTEAVKKELLDYCKENIAKYALPYDIEFMDDFPKTLVGKIAYRVLEEAEQAK